jgi:dipeptidyl aminopeptidase/acylaminoacyl peptidase
MQQYVRSAAILIAAVGTPLLAQQKPTVTAHADLAKWETLGAGALSPDGKFVAYDFRRADGTSELRYRSVSGGDEHTVRLANGPQFSDNSRWLLFTITPDTGGGGRGGRGGRGGGGGAGGGASRNKVGAIDLRTGSQTTFDDIQSFSLSSDGQHVALRRYPSPGRRSADVIVRDLDAATDLTFGNVSELAWNDDGALLAMTIDVESRTGNGVQLLDARTGTIKSLDGSPSHYAGLQWRPKSSDLAAMRSRVDSAFNDTSYTVIAWRGVSGGSPSKLAYDFTADRSFPGGMRVASYRAPQWSEDGSTIFFGIAPRDPKIEIMRRGAGELPPARVQVWHAKDVRQFHQQEVNAAQDRQRTTLVAWHPGQASVVRLGEDPFEQVQIAANGAVVQTSDQAPYAPEYMSGRAVEDIYLVDPSTGKRNKILAKSPFGVTLSPSGNTAIYQQGGQWWALDIAKNTRTNLTAKTGSNFMNTEDDHPTPERRAYGAAGFTKDEKSVILYDRFDLWQVNLDGSNPVRLTRGKEDSTVYRCASEGGGGRGGRGGRGGGGGAASSPCSLDGEGRTIDTSKPLILTATGEYNKKSGYAKLTIGQPVQRLVWADKQVSGLRQAQDSDVYLMQQQSYTDSPNYFVASAALSDAKPVSNTNAFQSNYAWGKQVLMDYQNRRGDKLQMMLTYPANYEPGKKYPMVVYYYEKLSQGFHQYVTPSERSPYSTQNFSQNGYFVLRPDILFQPRNPGYSGLDCVESAVRQAIKNVADIDPKRVGNMGHSWGGYQSAFYAVHNHDTFAATIAGAPLTDLISFYGYTSGNSGLGETGHFETGQERMQVSLWEDPQAFIRNSTVFSLDSLHTPLLLEEGDADGNVNPFQSQEVYNFARRLGKNVVYLVYEGENHNVARPESQADYTKRQLEWFGHYLKGEPAAKWITEGETYAARQKILKDGTAPGAAVQAGNPRPNPERP